MIKSASATKIKTESWIQQRLKNEQNKSNRNKSKSNICINITKLEKNKYIYIKRNSD